MLAAPMALAVVPVLVTTLSHKVAVIGVLFAAGVVFLTGAYVVEAIRIVHTSLAIDGERVRYRFEFVVTKQASVPRERVRTVEVTADPVQRLLGIATLKLGSGEKNGQITLRALDRRLAEALRDELLARPAATVPDGAETHDAGTRPGGGTGERTRELARWDPRWLRYAPLSFWTLVLAAAAFGLPLQVASWFGASTALWDRVSGPVRDLGLLWGVALIALVALAALLAGAVVSVLVSAEAWWGYRLERAPDGTLHVERGLLVRRSTTFEGRRIRGAVFVEPLGTRLAGGARIDLIALGLGGADDNSGSQSSTVLPDAPRRVAADVFAALTGEPLPARLVAHPPAAQAKRLRWAAAATVTAAAVAVAVAVLTPVGWWLVGLVVVLVAPASGWLAVAAYAALGHALTGHHVYIRYGALRRATYAVRRDAIVSWNIYQSVLQRRVGLAGIGATIAADQAVVIAPDVGNTQARGMLADTDRPLWTPFL